MDFENVDIYNYFIEYLMNCKKKKNVIKRI